MDDGDSASTRYNDFDDERRERLEEARDRIDAAIKDYISIVREDDFADDPPFVQGWLVSAEWTNVEAERDNWGGRDVIAPHGQMLSVGHGLAAWASTRHE